MFVSKRHLLGTLKACSHFMQVAFGSGIIMDKVVGFEDGTLDRG